MVAIYCRTSKNKRDGEDQSIPSQKEEGVRFAQSQGWDYTFFVDEGISGAKDNIEDRPAFADMINEINKKKFTAVYCLDQSRIERNSGVWNLFVGYMLTNKCEYYPSGKSFDLNDPHNILIANIISATNQFYAALTSRKVKLANDRKVKEGKTHGMLAYGYQRNDNGFYEIVEEEAEIVRRIYTESLEGLGSYTIAKGLNADNIPTKFNRYSGEIVRKDEYTSTVTRHKKGNVRWRGNVVHDVIINTIYKGERRWKDVEAAKVPSIVSEELWEKVNANLKNNKKNVGRKEDYHYLLNGLLYCHHCESEFRGKKRLKGNDNSYKCKGVRPPQRICSDSRGISLPKLETFILKHLFESKELKDTLINSPIRESENEYLKKRLKILNGKLSDLTKRKERAYKILLDEDLKDDREIKNDLVKTKGQIDELEFDIQSVEHKIFERENMSRNKRAKSIIEGFSSDHDFDSIKQAVHSLIDKILIKHQKGEKGGVYSLVIKYKGFDEFSTFVTNHQCFNWYWVGRYRKGATNEAENALDREEVEAYLKFKGVEITDESLDAFGRESGFSVEEIARMDYRSDGFSGIEQVAAMNEIVVLKFEELVNFD